jgi:hypothetical protein
MSPASGYVVSILSPMTRHIRTFDSVVRLDPAHLCCSTFVMVYRAAKLLVWDVRKFKQPFILRPCEMDRAQWNDLDSTGLRTPSAINCKIYSHFVTIKVPGTRRSFSWRRSVLDIIHWSVSQAIGGRSKDLMTNVAMARCSKKSHHVVL